MQHTITMQPISVYFPNLQLLWAFEKTLKTHNLEINTREISLCCVCGEEDIARALSHYKASLSPLSTSGVEIKQVG